MRTIKDTIIEDIRLHVRYSKVPLEVCSAAVIKDPVNGEFIFLKKREGIAFNPDELVELKLNRDPHYRYPEILGENILIKPEHLDPTGRVAYELLKDYANEPTCTGCGHTPENITEYSMNAKGENMSATEWMILNEGTYDTDLPNQFYCTNCYFKHSIR